MNAEDLYRREDLMTPEELEEWHFEPSSAEVETLSPLLRQWILFGGNGEDGDGFRPSPEAATRRAFERRPSALGATPALLAELQSHYDVLPPVQKRMLYRHVRSTMLRQLISCDGATDINDLVNILQGEMDSGIPSPVPEWYKYSTVTMGPRKIGYDGCVNRNCHRTESHDKPKFANCSKCKVAVYCSRDCQVEDWKARHKKVCKEAAEEREKMVRVGKMMRGLSDLSMTGQDMGDLSGLNGLNYHEARRNPAVQERRRQLRTEKKRPQGQPAEGPDPKFF